MEVFERFDDLAALSQDPHELCVVVMSFDCCRVVGTQGRRWFDKIWSESTLAEKDLIFSVEKYINH